MGIASVRLALSVLVALLGTAGAAEDVRGERARLDREARGAYERKDYAAFLQASRRLVELGPGSGRGLYNLACAQALAGRPDEAVATLDRIARMGIVLDAGTDPDLAPLKGAPAFEAVLARMAALGAPMGRSRVAFSLPEKDLITEGIAQDPQSGDFFVSSVHRRKVLRVSPDGRVADFVTEGQDGLLSALALAVDPRRRSLYVSSEAMPSMLGLRPEDKGRSFVVDYDVDSGRARRTLTPPSGAGEAHLGDLSVGPDGTLAVSDPQSGRVYVLPPSDSTLRVLVEAGPLVSPQGLAFSPDGRWIFVADYARGIARIDPRGGAVGLLPAPEDAPVGGIDGLVYVGDSLVGIENGYSPHKVVRMRLAADQARIVESTVLERSNPLFDEPTLGVVVGDELYYVATSQYSKVREDGSLDLERLKPPLVLRMPISQKH
jgi:sugar lactone lactonase YvrE